MHQKKQIEQEKLLKSFHERKAQLLEEIRQEVFNRSKDEYGSQYIEVKDVGDQSVTNLLESLNLQLAGIQQEELKNIERAEQKVQDGTYGTCEECGAKIGRHRLAAVPFAVLCHRCKKQNESEISREREHYGSPKNHVTRRVVRK